MQRISFNEKKRVYCKYTGCTSNFLDPVSSPASALASGDDYPQDFINDIERLKEHRPLGTSERAPRSKASTLTSQMSLAHYRPALLEIGHALRHLRGNISTSIHQSKHTSNLILIHCWHQDHRSYRWSTAHQHQPNFDVTSTPSESFDPYPTISSTSVQIGSPRSTSLPQPYDSLEVDRIFYDPLLGNSQTWIHILTDCPI